MGCNNSKEAYKAEYANPNTTTTDDNDAGGDAKAAEETDPKLRTQQQKEGGDGGGDVEEEEGQTVICTRCRNANPHTSQRCAMCGLALVQIMIAPLQAARRDAHDAKKQQSPRGALMGKIPAFASRREDKEPGIPVAPPVVMRQLSVEQGMQESAQNLTHARGALLHAIKDGRNLRTARIGQKKRPVNALLHKVRLPVVSAAQAKLLATPAPPAPPVLKPIEKKSELIHKPDLWKGVMKELTTPNPRGQPTKVFSDLTHDEQGYVTRALENTVDEEGFYVSLGHLNQKIQELSDVLDLGDGVVTSFELLEMAKEGLDREVTEDVLCLWANYSGRRMFHNNSQIIDRMETVVNYCETDAKASPGIKSKLRYVTKTLRENSEIERGGIYVLLAAHGQMCNVQKEVGVSSAYGMLTNTTKEDQKAQSIEQLVIKQLYTLRENVLEEMYMIYNSNKNTHPMTDFRNRSSAFIGLAGVPDPQPSTCTKKPSLEMLGKFYERYSIEFITSYVAMAMNEEPKKLPYDAVVNWYKEHSLRDDPYEFLGDVFDMMTGKIKISMIKYFLFKIGVLSHVDGEDCKFELPGDSDCEEEVNVDEDGTEEAKAVQQEKREEKKEEGVEEEAPPMPVLVRQVSADPRMPKMIRQRSMEALEIEAEANVLDRFAEAQFEVAINLNPADFEEQKGEED